MPGSKKIFPDLSVLLIALAALFIPVIITEHTVLQYTHGVFIYPLDDTFIHMDIAKNIVQHATWGITNNVFASASSSLFYTIILAICFKIFSVNYLFPFIINCFAAVALIISVQSWLKRNNISSIAQLIILLCVIFFTPLPALVISGMEHTLQCLFVFLFLFKCSDWLEANEKSSSANLPVSVYFFAMLVTAIRYEGIFLVAVMCLMLLINKKIIAAFLLGFVSLLPLIIFGIYSLHKGSYFLPNSVLLKSQTSGVSFLTFISNILIDKLTTAATITALATQRLLILLPAVYFIFFKKLKQTKSYQNILIVLIFTTLFHLAFAATGWFYRYEAYLVFASVIIIGVCIYKYWKEMYAEYKPAKWIMAVIIFALSFPFILRSSAAFTKASQACINIYEQQYQMGSFVNKFYNEKTVAANDIGAVSFLSNAKVLDLWGLGNIDVAKSKKNNYWTPHFLDSTSKAANTKLAIVYDSWFNKDLLCKWTKIATWKIQNNVICGDATISFYAVDANDSTNIKNNLTDFQKQLPAGVQVVYLK